GLGGRSRRGTKGRKSGEPGGGGAGRPAGGGPVLPCASHSRKAASSSGVAHSKVLLATSSGVPGSRETVPLRMRRSRCTAALSASSPRAFVCPNSIAYIFVFIAREGARAR